MLLIELLLTAVAILSPLMPSHLNGPAGIRARYFGDNPTVTRHK